MGSWRRESASGPFREASWRRWSFSTQRSCLEWGRSTSSKEACGRERIFSVDYTRNVCYFWLIFLLNQQKHCFSASFRDLSQAKLEITSEWSLNLLSRPLWWIMLSCGPGTNSNALLWWSLGHHKYSDVTRNSVSLSILKWTDLQLVSTFSFPLSFFSLLLQLSKISL